MCVSAAVVSGTNTQAKPTPVIASGTISVVVPVASVMCDRSHEPMTNRTTPVQVSGITGAVGLTAGWWHHSCALLGGGTVRCWGANDWGQFGNGTRTSSSIPVTMSP